MKKYLCLVLCLMMIFTAVNVTLVQASGVPENLSASYVAFSASAGGAALTTFPATNTSIFASTNITNNGVAPKAAVLWVGVYQKSVLVDVEYQRLEIPGGASATFTTPAIAIKEGYNLSDTDIKAYVWDSFTGANAVVGSASFLKDSGELRDISVNGVPITGFNSATTDYTCYVTPGALIIGTAQDNATKVETSIFTLPGTAKVTATASNGTIKTYTIKLKINGKITSFAKNLACPKTSALNYGDPLIPVTAYAYTDRSSGTSMWPLTYVSADLVGDTLIRMPVNDIRLTASDGQANDMIAFMNGNNDYYSFTADTAGRIIALASVAMDNYTNVANGWTTLNNGTSFYPVTYNGHNYTDYNKIDNVTTTDILPKTFTPAKFPILCREQSGQGPTIYKYAYVKYFNAGETVQVKTPDNASVGYNDGAVWVVTWGITNPVLDVEPAPVEAVQ